MSRFPVADKKFGQHFLHDKNIIKAITEDFAREAKVIVEVGPGPAVLTPALAAHDKPLYLLEKDLRFKERLMEYTTSDKLIMGDALEFEWKQIDSDEVWLVSNLPYNVGTQLFINFLQIPQIKYMTLMFQKEVGIKTVVSNKKNQMNGLCLLSTNYFNAKVLKKVPGGAFSPPPKVESVVVSYQRKPSPEISIDKFKAFNNACRLLFSNKRKQIQSVLKVGLEPEVFKRVQTEFPAIMQLRAEALSHEQAMRLVKCLISG